MHASRHIFVYWTRLAFSSTPSPLVLIKSPSSYFFAYFVKRGSQANGNKKSDKINLLISEGSMNFPRGITTTMICWERKQAKTKGVGLILLLHHSSSCNLLLHDFDQRHNRKQKWGQKGEWTEASRNKYTHAILAPTIQNSFIVI